MTPTNSNSILVHHSFGVRKKSEGVVEFRNFPFQIYGIRRSGRVLTFHLTTHVSCCYFEWNWNCGLHLCHFGRFASIRLVFLLIFHQKRKRSSFGIGLEGKGMSHLRRQVQSGLWPESFSGRVSRKKGRGVRPDGMAWVAWEDKIGEQSPITSHQRFLNKTIITSLRLRIRHNQTHHPHFHSSNLRKEKEILVSFFPSRHVRSSFHPPVPPPSTQAQLKLKFIISNYAPNFRIQILITAWTWSLFWILKGNSEGRLT